MSTPQHPHHLRREQEKGAGGQYVAARYAQMRCDGGMGLCRIPPERAPLILVPATPFSFLAPIAVFTTLHYCRRHLPEIPPRPEFLLNDRLKAQIERRCRAKWPHEYRPDFDRAYVKWELVTTPEYRGFLEKLEQGRTLSGDGIPLL